MTWQKKIGTGSIAEKRRFWYVHIRAWEKSGLIQAEYCRQHNLRENRQTDPGVKIQLGNIAISLTENFNPEVLALVVHTLGGKA